MDLHLPYPNTRKLHGASTACHLPMKALLAQAPGSLDFLKARNTLFKFMLAFNCHKDNLLKSLSQAEMKRKHLK